MPGYQIRRRFAHHELGTKAYQIWEIQKNDAVALVFQYGKFTTGMDPSRMGGTVDVRGVASQGAIEIAARKQEKAKTARGYREWDVDVCPMDSSGDFHTTLRAIFGTSKTDQIMLKLDAAQGTQVSGTTPASAPDHSVMGTTKPPAPRPEESSPEWGTW
ncbi:MAG: hypothetical protein M3O74_13620 [Pseudomonadota bacterium]|nr:hypothetical protein [Pseudomonadota bacterium]